MNKKFICEKCQNPLYEITISGKRISHYLCIICNPPEGFCPNCKTELRTNKARQCPKCHASWHHTIEEIEKIQSKILTEKILTSFV